MSCATKQNNSHSYDTIIIGAGVSGLACAARLFQHQARTKSNRSILVLEARDRIGGRVGSVRVNGCRLDTGANWIHGIGTKERPNPLMDILPKKRVKQLSGSVAFKPPPPPQDGKRDEDGWELVNPPAETGTPEPASAKDDDRVIPPEIAGDLMGTMWMLFDSLHETANSTSADKAKSITMLKAIADLEVFQNAFNEVPESYHEALRAMPQFIENMEAAPLVAQSAETDTDAPGMGLLEYAIDDFDGDQVFVQDGYTAVVEDLAKGVVDSGLVELGAEIESIRWDKSPLTVSIKDRSTFEAKNVVCTLPLGVLKDRHATIFDPPLPKEKRESIESLGFGTLDKVFLVYDRAWWTEGPFNKIIGKGVVRPPTESESTVDTSAKEPDILMGYTHDLAGLAIHPNGKSEPGMRNLSLINLHSLTGFPVLSCFVSCGNARHIESLSDSKAQALLHDNLTTWFGREIPKPAGVHVTRWADDPFSQGSYSHMITGRSETKHRVDFQKAIDVDEISRLGFAGEHTSKTHFATVHGALISGWREADAIIEGWEKGLSIVDGLDV
ncbi:uncharacterized protein LTR77_007603 [Saxophila tyrrhenica]|uniref:Amine oxidase domain-containing protein n=1 Tax=Saxophila tyrrhenica TaxID=1690608 RepID=A0AAV9P2J4_9PEZI|nr:hypothetical protein LTR77_007603 [Saxophila tyrrhenica]